MQSLWNPFVLLLLGLVMIFFEFFVPGAVLGITGGALLFLSLIAFALSDYPFLAFFPYLLFVVISLVGVIRLALWSIKRTGKENTIMSEKNQTGYVASSFDQTLIGLEGVADTDLKPSGKVIINGVEHQAVSEMGYINKGTPVLVINGEGAHLIVKEKH